VIGYGKIGGNLVVGEPWMDFILVEDIKAFDEFEDKAEHKYQKRQPIKKRMVDLSGMIEESSSFVSIVGEKEASLYLPFLSLLEIDVDPFKMELN